MAWQGRAGRRVLTEGELRGRFCTLCWNRGAGNGILEPDEDLIGRAEASAAGCTAEAGALTAARWGAGFAATGRFVAEMEAAAAGKGTLKAGYVMAGDEAFLLDRCRAAVLKGFVPAGLREFCLSDLDLASTSIFDVLDRAQTPSLMAPFQVIFIRNVRQLYTRGAKKDEFAALERYFRWPNPQALLIGRASCRERVSNCV